MREVDTELFIGGPADGLRAAVRRNEHQVAMERAISPQISDPSAPPPFTRAWYHREWLAGPNAVYSFWLHDDLPLDAALERLFDVYPAERGHG